MNHSVQRIVNRLSGSIDPIQVSPDVSCGIRISRRWFVAANATGGISAVAAFHFEHFGGAESGCGKLRINVFAAAEGTSAVSRDLIHVMSGTGGVLKSQSVVQIVTMMADVSRVRVPAVRARAIVHERMNGASCGRSVRDIFRGETVAAQSAQRALKVTAQSGIIDVDVSRLIILADVSIGAFHVIQETRSRYMIQTVLVITAMRSVATRYPLVYSLVHMIRVVLVVLRQRFIPWQIRRNVVILAIVIIQTLVNIFLRFLMLLMRRYNSAIVIAYHINRILIIRIQIRMNLYRIIARTVLKTRNVTRILIDVVSLLIVSPLIHHRRG